MLLYKQGLHHMSSSDRICHSCWMCCKRSAIHIGQADEAHGVSMPITSEPVNESLEVPSEVVSSDITLANYRHAGNTALHCLFPQCTNMNLHKVADSFRASILSTYKYYILVHSCVCTEHRLSNEWSNLYYSSNSMSTFTSQQVEHIFSFVNSFNSFKRFR